MVGGEGFNSLRCGCSGMTTLAITIYDRTPEVIRAMCAGLSLPGNRPDVVAVCYDRAPEASVDQLRDECNRLGFELWESHLDDDFRGPRCPSLAWNTVLATTKDPHVFCMSSDVVLAPHSIGMAYHMSAVGDNCMIVGRAEHCGQSYAWPGPDNPEHLKWRTITWSGKPSGLGFAWLLPMKAYKDVGGFDEGYMKGYCYEDDDFVLKMWNSGSDFLFCDDIVGFHLEHKRDHLRDEDGRVALNGKIFLERWGDIDMLRKWKFKHAVSRFDVGLTQISHKRDKDVTEKYFWQQKFYGQNEPWRAIPVVEKQKFIIEPRYLG